MNVPLFGRQVTDRDPDGHTSPGLFCLRKEQPVMSFERRRRPYGNGTARLARIAVVLVFAASMAAVVMKTMPA